MNGPPRSPVPPDDFDPDEGLNALVDGELAAFAQRARAHRGGGAGPARGNH